MNIGHEARDHMRLYAAHGRMGSQAIQPRVDLDAPRNAERGQVVQVGWRVAFAENVVLRTTPPGGPVATEVVPAVGRRGLRLEAVGQYRVEILATPSTPRAAGRRRPVIRPVQAQIEVVAPKPVIRLDGPARVTFGEPARVTWAVVEADEARLLVDGELRSIELVGALDVELETCGEHVVTAIAAGDGGRYEHTIRICVVAPPVIISAPAEAVALLDDMARFNYSISGAREAWLDPMDRREPPYPIKLAGRIETQATLEPERIRIVAEGHDGRRTHRTITVSAKFFDDVSFDEEIAFLNEGLR